MNEAADIATRAQRFNDTARTFTPPLPIRHAKLAPIKDGIVELRQKGASLRLIRELLATVDGGVGTLLPTPPLPLTTRLICLVVNWWSIRGSADRRFEGRVGVNAPSAPRMASRPREDRRVLMAAVPPRDNREERAG